MWKCDCGGLSGILEETHHPFFSLLMFPIRLLILLLAPMTPLTEFPLSKRTEEKRAAGSYGKEDNPTCQPEDTMRLHVPQKLAVSLAARHTARKAVTKVVDDRWFKRMRKWRQNRPEKLRHRGSVGAKPLGNDHAKKLCIKDEAKLEVPSAFQD